MKKSFICIFLILILLPCWIQAQDRASPGLPIPQKPQVQDLVDLEMTSVVYLQEAFGDYVVHYFEAQGDKDFVGFEQFRTEVYLWDIRRFLIFKDFKKGKLRVFWMMPQGIKKLDKLNVQISMSPPKGANYANYTTQSFDFELTQPQPFGAEHKALSDLARHHIESLRLRDSWLQSRVRRHLERELGVEPSKDLQNRYTRSNKRPDLMSVFTGALAVQETLQADILEGQFSLNPLREIDPQNLKGPQIPSHPWAQMNAQSQKPSLGGPLASLAPEDHFYFEAKSLKDLIDLEKELETWVAPLMNLVSRENKDLKLRERWLKRLGLGDSFLAKQLGPTVIGEVAVVAPDFFFIEGTSMALVMELKAPQVFMSYLLAKFGRGVAPNAADHVIVFATPKGPLYYWDKDSKGILATDPLLMKQILDVVGQQAPSLAAAGDHQYIRRLLPREDDEAVFIYFSDAAIRKWLSPRYKILERRRLIAHMKMLDASVGQMLGEPAQDISSWRSEYGTLWNLKPIDALELGLVSADEKKDYERFVRNYSKYWSKYFDPIGVQILDRGNQLSLKTVVLPLIENTVYSQLQEWTQGVKPQEAAPTVKGEIFQMSFAAPKHRLLPSVALLGGTSSESGKAFQALTGEARLRIFDGEPVVFFDITKIPLNRMSSGLDFTAPTALITFLTMPSCIELKHTDIKAVKEMVNRLPQLTGSMMSKDFQLRHVRLSEDFGEVDVYAIQFFGLNFRFWFWVDQNRLVMANRLEVLRALAQGSKEKAQGPKAHAHLAWRPSAMKKLQTLSTLGRLEEGNHACWQAQSERRLGARLGIDDQKWLGILGYLPICPLGEDIRLGDCQRHGTATGALLMQLKDEDNPLPDLHIHLTLESEGLFSEINIFR